MNRRKLFGFIAALPAAVLFTPAKAEEDFTTVTFHNCRFDKPPTKWHYPEVTIDETIKK